MGNKNTLINSNLNFFYILTFISFIFLIFSISYTKIFNFDLLWHLKTGYYIISNKTFLKVDPYSGYLNNAKWFNFHNLFQILIAYTHSFFGFKGLTVLKCSLFFTIYGLIYNWKESSLTFLFFIFISILGFSSRVMLRPELLSYLYLIILLKLILHHKNNKLKLMFIFFIQLLMVNSHSVFMVGPIVIFFKILELFFFKKREEFVFYIKALFVSIFACAINPYGFRGLIFPFHLLPKVIDNGDVFKENVLEFASHNFSDLSNIFKSMYIVLIIVVILYSLSKKQLFHVFLLSSFTYLALKAERNFNLLICISLSLIPSSFFSEYIESKINSLFLKKLILKVLIFLSFFYGMLFMSNRIYRKENRLERFGQGLSEVTFSDTLNDFLKQLPYDAKIFNTMSLGGYIIFFNYPLKVFYDGRLDVYGMDYLKMYIRMANDLEFFLKKADELNIDYVVLNHSINESRKLMDLYKKPSWKLVFIDSYSVVFARTEIAKKMEDSGMVKKDLFKIKSKVFYNNITLHKDDVNLLDQCFKIAVSDMQS